MPERANYLLFIISALVSLKKKGKKVLKIKIVGERFLCDFSYSLIESVHQAVCDVTWLAISIVLIHLELGH
jgi:hypothetical protein